jgi:chromosomal replication initiation ATPase DnaA
MGNTARKVALYLAQRYAGLSNREIGGRFGGIDGSAVSKVSIRMKEEMASNKQLSTLVSELDSSFKA